MGTTKHCTLCLVLVIVLCVLLSCSGSGHQTWTKLHRRSFMSPCLYFSRTLMKQVCCRFTSSAPKSLSNNQLYSSLVVNFFFSPGNKNVLFLYSCSLQCWSVAHNAFGVNYACVFAAIGYMCMRDLTAFKTCGLFVLTCICVSATSEHIWCCLYKYNFRHCHCLSLQLSAGFCCTSLFC